jgi:hypothetical protein
MLVVLGAIILFVVARYFQETLPVRDANALRPRVLARTAGGILGNGSFWAFALLSACSFGGLFCFLSASSYVFIRILGVAPRYYGVVLLVMMIFYIKGTVLCRYLILHGGGARAAHRGAVQPVRWRADGRAGAGRGEQRVGDLDPGLHLQRRPRHQPALRAERRGGALPQGGRRGVGAVGLPDDAGRLCLGQPGGRPDGRHGAADGAGRGRLERGGGGGGLGLGSPPRAGLAG